MKKAALFILLLCIIGIGGGFVYQSKFVGHSSDIATTLGNTANEAGTPVNQTTNGTQQTPTPSKPPVSPVSDDSPIRGVIEGFYGQPWTQAQRISMFSFMSHNHLNVYVYAPKDDPYQRSAWGELYPQTQFLDMSALVKVAQSDAVRFVYSISPGIPAPLPGQSLTSEMIAQSITFTSHSDLMKLERKIDQLRGMGVHTLMLSFDDVEKSLKIADQSVYGSDYARAHVDLANKILSDEKHKDPNFHLWFAPTTYYGLNDNHYWVTIRTRLNPSIQVIWTGKWVLNQSITGTEAARVATRIGRKPLLWDNYPVNDYTYVVKKAPMLLMGPLEHRSPDLEDHIAGYIANPMLQPEASKVALATVGQYLTNPRAYVPTTAWQHAIQSVGGVGDPAAFRLFCSYSSKSTVNTVGYAPFSALANSFWTSRSTQHGANLRKELETLQNLPGRLHSTLANQALVSEIDPWLTKLGQEGQTGLLALDYLDTSTTDPERAAKRQKVVSHLQALQNNSLQIGDEVITFIQQVLAH